MSLDRGGAPHSPCINICVLDGSGHCTGCLRTLEEIAGWARYSPQERWAVLDRVDARRNET